NRRASRFSPAWKRRMLNANDVRNRLGHGPNQDRGEIPPTETEVAVAEEYFLTGIHQILSKLSPELPETVIGTNTPHLPPPRPPPTGPAPPAASPAPPAGLLAGGGGPAPRTPPARPGPPGPATTTPPGGRARRVHAAPGGPTDRRRHSYHRQQVHRRVLAHPH